MIRAHGIFATRWLMLGWIAATVVSALAMTVTQDPWMAALAAVLVTGFIGSVGLDAIWELRRWGARPFVVGVVAIATIGLLVMFPLSWSSGGAIPLAVREVVGLVFVAVLAASWVASRRVVDLAGGPRVEWRLLRERYQIWSDYADVSPTDTQATKAARARIRALDAFRGPSTSIYIDLFQALTLDASDAPRSTAEVDAVTARFRQAEADLFRSLVVRPAWEPGLRTKLGTDDPARSAVAGARDPGR